MLLLTILDIKSSAITTVCLNTILYFIYFKLYTIYVILNYVFKISKNLEIFLLYVTQYENTTNKNLNL